ncbi:MAG: hypothetical protein EHM70_23880 [Chloroflexota bacterium]|nr:MAG: hypothetical protein EHM70_23880 [Chloroflexota bacterium]
MDVINLVDAHPLPGGQWEQALVNMSIYTGGEVWAKEASTARVWLASNLVRVAPNTIFTVSRPGDDELHLDLQEGQIWINVEGLAPGESFDVETPAVVASVRGTRFSVRVEESGETIVSTVVNTVTLSNPSGTVELGAGWQTQVLPGQSPSPPEPITFEENLLWGMAVGENLDAIIPVIDVTHVFSWTAMTGEASWSHDSSDLSVFYYDPQASDYSQPMVYDTSTNSYGPPPIPPRVSQVTFNPVSDELAYVTIEDADFEICVSKSDGSDTNCFGEPGHSLSDPLWSRDGEHLLFQYSSPAANLYIARPDGTEMVQLTYDTSGSNYCASWSPDGSKIAYFHGSAQYPGVTGDVWVMNADGSNPQVIFEDAVWGHYEGHLAWSPNGLWLAIPSAGGLFLVSPDGSIARHVEGTGEGLYYDLTWSPTPSGWPLFFSSTPTWMGERSTWYLASEEVQPVSLPGTEWGPVWSPDGQKGAFAQMADAGGKYITTLYLFDVEPGFGR